ncbi:MAG TPA: SDR family NAD(P)-dependent oxidoreductase [Anaeromyxobacteraceae bacterium]|nr:SDR family NAD(P)-dependent oxidoreductase [Anaeromyxobacteraceae bacterium]
MRFDGRTVLVAGGTGALGRSVVHAFLAEGAVVVVAGRREAELGPVAAAAGPAAARLHFVQADVSEPAGAESAVAAAAVKGPLRAVVNAVGGWAGGAPVQAEGPEVLGRMLSLNLAPGYHLLRAALPVLLEGGGAFVEVVSLAALGPQPGQAAYAASKAAALAVVLAAAEEVRGRGVRVNAVLPGTMDTEANRRAMPAADRAGWVSTRAVASAILYLCSDEAAGVTGAAVPVTAGASA